MSNNAELPFPCNCDKCFAEKAHYAAVFRQKQREKEREQNIFDITEMLFKEATLEQITATFVYEVKRRNIQ